MGDSLRAVEGRLRDVEGKMQGLLSQLNYNPRTTLINVPGVGGEGHQITTVTDVAHLQGDVYVSDGLPYDPTDQAAGFFTLQAQYTDEWLHVRGYVSLTSDSSSRIVKDGGGFCDVGDLLAIDLSTLSWSHDPHPADGLIPDAAPTDFSAGFGALYSSGAEVGFPAYVKSYGSALFFSVFTGTTIAPILGQLPVTVGATAFSVSFNAFLYKATTGTDYIGTQTALESGIYRGTYFGKDGAP